MKPKNKKPERRTRQEIDRVNQNAKIIVGAKELVARCIALNVGGIRFLTPSELKAAARRRKPRAVDRSTEKEIAKRDKDVMELSGKGFSISEIARKLGISKDQVSTSRRRNAKGSK